MANAKIKLTFGNGKNFTYNKIKETATDQNVVDTAIAFSKLRAGALENIYKIIETEIASA